MQKLNCAILIIRPKAKFFEFIEEVAVKNGVGKDQIYFPEEDGVYLIPTLDSFNGNADLTSYIRKTKPQILQRELAQFGTSIEGISAEMFDEFYDLEFKDAVIAVDENYLDCCINP